MKHADQPPAGRWCALRQKLVTVLLVGLVAIVSASAPAGAAPGPTKSCPEGFNLGALTFKEALQLPKLRAALSDGVTTIEQVQAVHLFADKNGNGVLCFQDVAQRGNAAPVSGSLYAVVLVDDNAAVAP